MNATDKKPFNKKKRTDNIPVHVRNLAFVVRNNAEIRRFTSKGIIYTLSKNGVIKKTDKVYVDFMFTKFSISINGLKTEYTYNNQMFLNALCASFNSFVDNAQNIINDFLEKENSKVQTDEVRNIIDNNDSLPVEGDDADKTAAE